MSAVGDRLRQLRLDAGFTQAELGRRSRTYQMYIHHIESGRNRHPGKIGQIAKVLKVPESLIMYGVAGNREAKAIDIELETAIARLSLFGKSRLLVAANAMAAGSPMEEAAKAMMKGELG